jgi:hypothetical protein
MLMIAALAGATASPAYPVNVAGWLVAQRTEGCAMGSEFAGPGHTYVAVDKKSDGKVYLAITNDAWSAREGKRYDVAYRLNGKEYADGTTTGYRSGAARGFWSVMGAGFERDFAAGADLSVFLDGDLIRKISLAGTGAAIAALERCVSELHGRDREERREKRGHVPADPFADPTATPPARPAPKPRS